MKVTFWKLFLVFLYFAHVGNGFTRNTSLRPAVVNVGAILDFNSTIGRVAKVAIELAVKDVNSNASILHGTKLVLAMKDSGCSRFSGAVQALELMESGKVIAVIGPQSSKIAHLTTHVTNAYRVPALSFGATDPSLSYIQFPFFVRTTGSDLYQMTAIADIISHYGWKQVISVFIDDEHGRNGIAALDTALVERNCKISHKLRISPSPDVSKDDITNILVEVALSDSRVIVLHAYDDIGFRVFSVARYLRMMGKGYVWIATDWLSSALVSSSPLPSDTIDALQGVLSLRQHIPETQRKRAFFSRWKKLTGGRVGLNTYGLYAYDTVWLVAHAIDSFLNQGGNISFSNNYKLNPVEAYFAIFGDNPHFDGGRHLLKNILESDLAGLTGPLKFNPDRSLVLPSYDIVNVVGTRLRIIGYCSNNSHLSAVTPEVLYSPPPNMSRSNQKLVDVLWPGDTLSKPRGWVFPNNGKQLRIGVPIPVSFTEFVSKVEGSDAYKGYCIDVFKAAVNLLPYAVPYQFVAYGDGQETPSYTELVKLVSTRFFDAAIGDIAITTNRSKIVDFTQPFAVSGLEVVAPFMTMNTGAWVFLQPLSLPVWGFFAFFVLLVGAVLWILERRVNDDFRGSSMRQLKTILWFCFCREHTMSTLGRIVLIIWLFVVLILNESYTASLSSRLMVQHLSSPIKGIETLKTSGDPIRYTVGSFVEQYLIEEIGIPKSRLVPLASPHEYAVALQRGPKHGGVAAVVDEKPYIESFLSVYCKFRIVGRSIKKGGWGFAFPRDSPLIVDISSAILTMTENGDLQRIHDEWFTSTTCKFESREIVSDRLHLESFWGLYLIIGIACILALGIYFSKIMPRSRRAGRSSWSRSSTSSEDGLQPRQLQQLMHSVHKRERETKRRKLE